MMGADVPVQHGGEGSDTFMNSGRDSVIQFNINWMVLLSKFAFPWKACVSVHVTPTSRVPRVVKTCGLVRLLVGM